MPHYITTKEQQGRTAYFVERLDDKYKTPVWSLQIDKAAPFDTISDAQDIIDSIVRTHPTGIYQIVTDGNDTPQQAYDRAMGIL